MQISPPPPFQKRPKCTRHSADPLLALTGHREGRQKSERLPLERVSQKGSVMGFENARRYFRTTLAASGCRSEFTQPRPPFFYHLFTRHRRRSVMGGFGTCFLRPFLRAVSASPKLRALKIGDGRVDRQTEGPRLAIHPGDVLRIVGN